MSTQQTNERTRISVEAETKKAPRFGTVEAPAEDNVFRAQTHSLDGVVKPPLTTDPAEIAKKSAAQKYLEKIGTSKKPSIRSNTAYLAERELSAAAADDDMGTRTGKSFTKYGIKSAKGSVSAVGVGVRGAARQVKLNRELKKDVKGGVYTKPEAKQISHESAKAGMLRSGARLGKSIKNTAGRAIEDWQGNDDLGVKTIVKTKNVVVDTKRVTRTLRNMRKTSKARAAARQAKKAAEGTNAGRNVLQRIAAGVKNIGAKIASALTGGTLGGVLGCVVVVVAIFGGVLAIIPSASVKSDDVELTKTYKYVTELDYELYEELAAYKQAGYDVVTYYLNGLEAQIESLEIITNADLILLYLDLKYEDYKFDNIIYGLFGGDTVKSEVRAIHYTLYDIGTDTYTEEVSETIPISNPVTGDEEEVTVTITITYMDVHINAQSVDAYLNMNMEQLLSPDEQELMELSYEVGMYTARQELGNPFGDKSYVATGRFGYRKHPVTGGKQDHTGIDISMPTGTDVINILAGTVDSVYYDAEYGNTVIVKNEKREVRYSHLGRVDVSEGQALSRSEAIGTVGSSGNVRESCLHIEYIKDGNVLNPQFYLDGCSAMGLSITGVAWLTDEELYAFAASYGVTLPQNLSEGRKNILKAAATGVIANIPYHYVWRSYYKLLPGVPDNQFGTTVPPDSKGRARKGTDCSGFVCWAYYTAGIYPTGWAWSGDESTGWAFVATPGILASPSMARITSTSLQPGDVGLINGTAGTADHTGIYLGRTSSGVNMWMHCSGSRGAICNGYTGFRIFISMRGI